MQFWSTGRTNCIEIACDWGVGQLVQGCSTGQCRKGIHTVVHASHKRIRAHKECPQEWDKEPQDSALHCEAVMFFLLMWLDFVRGANCVHDR